MRRLDYLLLCIITFAAQPVNGFHSSDMADLIKTVDIPSFGSCNNDLICNGSSLFASASTTGGTPPYLYRITGIEFSPTSEFEVTAGSYTLLTMDASGTIVENSFTITEPDQLLAGASIQSFKCSPFAGNINIGAAGGCPPYKVSWTSPTGGTLDQSILQIDSSGTIVEFTNAVWGHQYAFNVTDNNGCIIGGFKGESVINSKKNGIPMGPLFVSTGSPPSALSQLELSSSLDPNGLAAFGLADFPDVFLDYASVDIADYQFDCNDIGQQWIPVALTDTLGSVCHDSVLITIKDDLIPFISCPANITINSCNSLYFKEPTGFDNCEFELIQLSGPQNGDNLAPGNYNIVYKITDHSDNTRLCNTWVYVELKACNQLDSLAGETDQYSIADLFNNRESNYNRSSAIQVYPNPTLSDINISISQGVIPHTVLIYSIDGEVIKARSIEAHEIQLSLTEIPKGIYFICVNHSEGNITKKLIVQ